MTCPRCGGPLWSKSERDRRWFYKNGQACQQIVCGPCREVYDIPHGRGEAKPQRSDA